MSVRSERNGPVTTIVLSRPDVRNAVDRDTAAALAEPVLDDVGFLDLSRQQHVGMLGDPAVTNDPLRALGRRPPIPGAVLPILLRGRPVALLYLDDDGRELGAGS
jgi:hypothetical protein